LDAGEKGKNATFPAIEPLVMWSPKPRLVTVLTDLVLKEQPCSFLLACRSLSDQEKTIYRSLFEVDASLPQESKLYSSGYGFLFDSMGVRGKPRMYYSLLA
jgi:hypothetical protein